MDITPSLSESRQLIEAYGNGVFRVAGVDYTGSIMVFPGETIPWAVTDCADLSLDALADALSRAADIELLLIGTGKSHGFISPKLKQHVRQAGIIIDSMDTGAACRTFNVLLAEERRVAAVLIAI